MLLFLNRSVDKLYTDVHVISTNTGDCLNHNSIAPERYTIDIIKTVLHRTYKICMNEPDSIKK